MIPAVDIRGGRCVRLVQGRRTAELIYGDDPVEVAVKWQTLGARWLHVVDLDGAFAGRPVQRDLIARLMRAVTIPVQVGGGMRTIENVRQVLAAGASRVVLSTAARAIGLEAAADFGEQIAISLDVRDGRLVGAGWTAHSLDDPLALGTTLARAGVRWFILTDVSRDGMMSGPNVGMVHEFLEQVGGSVIAAGGITTDSDLAALDAAGAAGAILGRALYEGRLDLQKVLARWGDGRAH